MQIVASHLKSFLATSKSVYYFLISFIGVWLPLVSFFGYCYCLLHEVLFPLSVVLYFKGQSEEDRLFWSGCPVDFIRICLFINIYGCSVSRDGCDNKSVIRENVYVPYEIYQICFVSCLGVIDTEHVKYRHASFMELN